ncbi:MAG: hypothetical protein S4CHLAM45_06170 [Chlamydiales bacterium]|nr:hypothetical protein [Chlamydiales bacterium]
MMMNIVLFLSLVCVSCNKGEASDYAQEIEQQEEVRRSLEEYKQEHPDSPYIKKS